RQPVRLAKIRQGLVSWIAFGSGLQHDSPSRRIERRPPGMRHGEIRGSHEGAMMPKAAPLATAMRAPVTLRYCICKHGKVQDTAEREISRGMQPRTLRPCRRAL